MYKDTLFNILSEENSKFGPCKNQIDDYLYNKLTGNLLDSYKTDIKSQLTDKSQVSADIAEKSNILDTNDYHVINPPKSDISTDQIDKMARLETFQTEVDLSTNYKSSGITTPKYNDFIISEPYFRLPESKSIIKTVNRYQNDTRSRTDTITTEHIGTFDYQENDKYTPIVHRKTPNDNISTMRTDTCFEDGYPPVYFAANAEMAFIDISQLTAKFESINSDNALARWAIPKAQKHHSESVESLQRWYLSQKGINKNV